MQSILSPRSRTRGCQQPLSMQQVGTALVGLSMMALAIVTLFFVASNAVFVPLLATYCSLAAIVIFCYFYCSLADISKPGGIPCLCMKATQRTDRYCRVCQVTVPGFDHHCAVSRARRAGSSMALGFLHLPPPSFSLPVPSPVPQCLRRETHVFFFLLPRALRHHSLYVAHDQ